MSVWAILVAAGRGGAIVLTSWNEWHEGSQIEPSVAYGNQYLDITRDEINAYRSQPAGFADPAFFERWQRTDQAVEAEADIGARDDEA